MGNIFSDVGDFFSDVFEDVGDFAEDLWKSDAVQIIAPAVIGYAIGGPLGAAAGVKGGALTGAAIGAGYGLTSFQQKKGFERAESLQEKQFAAQRRQTELAGQQFTLTERQMQLQMGQRQIELLASLFDKQDRTEPEIYYLPAAEPTSPVTRINLAIEDFIRK